MEGETSNILVLAANILTIRSTAFNNTAINQESSFKPYDAEVTIVVGPHDEQEFLRLPRDPPHRRKREAEDDSGDK